MAGGHGLRAQGAGGIGDDDHGDPPIIGSLPCGTGERSAWCPMRQVPPPSVSRGRESSADDRLTQWGEMRVGHPSVGSAALHPPSEARCVQRPLGRHADGPTWRPLPGRAGDDGVLAARRVEGRPASPPRRAASAGRRALVPLAGHPPTMCSILVHVPSHTRSAWTSSGSRLGQRRPRTVRTMKRRRPRRRSSASVMTSGARIARRPWVG